MNSQKKKKLQNQHFINSRVQMWGSTFYLFIKSGVIIQFTQCASMGSLALLAMVLKISTVKELKNELVIDFLV